MAIKQEPFVRYNEVKKADTFTIRLNEEERRMLEEIKEVLNIPYDSKAMKKAARIGLNVLLTTFSKPLLKYLLSQKRGKLEDSET